MATLASANLPSEDEEDDDYDPTKDKTGEAGDGLGAHRKSKRRRPGRGAVGSAATGDSEEEDEDATAALLDSDDDGRRDPRKEEMKQKVDSIWNQLNSGGSSAKAGDKEPGSGVAAAGATAPAKARKKNKKRKSEVPDWMKQLGLAPSGGTAREKPSGEQQAPQEPVASASGAADEAAAERRAAAAAALEAARAASTTAKVQGVVSVTETQRFAGKDIKVQRELKEGSKELERAQAKAAAPATGLDVVLDTIATKKKVNVLGKSEMDWKGYKKGNEELHDELEAHKKSAGTYLEKQAFLKKAELSEYERERDQRLAADVLVAADTQRDVLSNATAKANRGPSLPKYRLPPDEPPASRTTNDSKAGSGGWASWLGSSMSAWASAMKQASRLGHMQSLLGTRSGEAAQGVAMMRSWVSIADKGMMEQDKHKVEALSLEDKQRIAQAADCSVRQVEGCVAAYVAMKAVQARQMERQREGITAPMTRGEMAELLQGVPGLPGIGGPSPPPSSTPRTSSRKSAQRKAAKSRVSTPAPPIEPFTRSFAEDCPLGSVLPGRNTKCPKTGLKYRACCGANPP